MPLSMLFWICMIFALLSSFYYGWQTPGPGRFGIAGWALFVWLLFLLLGWKVFGAAIK